MRIAGDDRIATAIEISRTTHGSAETAILARSDDFADGLSAAPLARALDAPLLLTRPDSLPSEVLAELRRLGVASVLIMGGPVAISRSVESELQREFFVERVSGSDRFGTAAEAAARLDPADGVIVVSGERFADAVSAAPLAAHLGWPLLLTNTGRLPSITASAIRDRGPSQILVVGGPAVVTQDVIDELRPLASVVRRLSGPDRYGTSVVVHREAVRRGMGTSAVWLATGADFPDALAAGAAVARSGGSLLLVQGRDVREPLETARYLRDLAKNATNPMRLAVVLGGEAAVTPNVDWQLGVVTGGRELPRGGFTLFPRYRMVAFYGNHSVAAMGVLGEQPPDQAYDRLWAQAAPYEAGGRPVLPTFELIVSVATKGAGPDGDYSAPSSPEQIQPWLDAARRHGVYLLLDLQTGRTDFLTEARRYEQFLVQPDVGLALDPEWRMDEGEVPGQSVGEVHADEVNAVADYLVGLVREHDLPQKLLVVHQFQVRMVEEKHLIGSPPELAVLFHMDGHGGQAIKKQSYAAVSDSTGRWWNGFKLFYDEDSDMFEPQELLDEIRPVPDFISYQ